MINMIYVALPMHAKTEKTIFSYKDDCTLTKHTQCWTYNCLWYFFYLYLEPTGCIKKCATLFLDISAPIKAKEIVFIWEDKRDPIVRFEYKTDSERCMLPRY